MKSKQDYILQWHHPCLNRDEFASLFKMLDDKGNLSPTLLPSLWLYFTTWLSHSLLLDLGQTPSDNMGWFQNTFSKELATAESVSVVYIPQRSSKSIITHAWVIKCPFPWCGRTNKHAQFPWMNVTKPQTGAECRIIKNIAFIASEPINRWTAGPGPGSNERLHTNEEHQHDNYLHRNTAMSQHWRNWNRKRDDRANKKIKGI